jgi:hypothetical protein
MKIHICLASLRTPVIEHLLIIREQARRVGVTTCLLDFGQSDFDLTKNGLHSDCNFNVIQHAEALADHLSTSSSSAIILQSPYPEHYPSWFEGYPNCPPLAYFGYGLPMSDWAVGHFAAPLVQKCSYLLASSHYEIHGYQENVPEAQTLLTGNPLLYELRRFQRFNTSSDFNQDRSTFLWAPHWTRSWTDSSSGYGRFQESCSNMLRWFRKNPNAKLRFRPHPLLGEALHIAISEGLESSHREARKSLNPALDVSVLSSLRALLELPNVTLSDKSLVQDILESSALVTDGVSIIGYWASTGKPMLILRDTNSAKFNSYVAELIKSADTCAPGKEIESWLEQIYQSPRENLLSRSIANSIFPTYVKSPVDIWMGSLKPSVLKRLRATVNRGTVRSSRQ